jgi:hypothetical protein
VKTKHPFELPPGVSEPEALLTLVFSQPDKNKKT